MTNTSSNKTNPNTWSSQTVAQALSRAWSGQFTKLRDIRAASLTVGVKIFNQIIVSSKEHFSFREHSLL